MNNDSAFISEVWLAIKENVDETQYLDICDKLVEIFDSFNTSDGFTSEVGFDQPLRLSIQTFFDIDEDEVDFDE
jgi:hypothetical protein